MRSPKRFAPSVARRLALRGSALLFSLFALLSNALANPLPAPGACCVSGGECRMLDENACIEQGGFWLGEEVPCDPNPCWGACCTETGTCGVIDLWTCSVYLGRFMGSGTSCDPDPCPMGACCLADGACAVLYPEDCAAQGGVFIYAGYPCEFEPCGVLIAPSPSAPSCALTAAPNPFTAGTTLTFILPDAGAGGTPGCWILDPSGRVVRAIEAGPAVGGAAVFRWDGRDEAGRAVAAGAYFARVRVGDMERSTVILRLR